MAKAYVAGTCDTKGAELRYIKGLIEDAGIESCLVDLGTGGGDAGAVDVPAAEVASHHPDGADAVLVGGDRGRAVTAMADAFAHFVRTRVDIGGMIGAGGSGNTALVATGMRALPLGVPKILVSTVASGDVAPYVGPNDIAMVYSVADVAGLNSITREVLGNAAHALAGMMRHNVPAVREDKPAIGLTMFGVTTDCVDQVRALLETDYDCLVFHATGTGGQSMEKLAENGFVQGCIDVTTTEVCDLLMGGVFSAGETRLDALASAGLPYVGSCGALDMVNFGARETIPEKYRERSIYIHNPQVSLMRTNAKENRAIGEWIGKKLNAFTGPVRFLMPEKGVSLIDAPDMPFHDPAADAALFEALEATLIATEARQLVRCPHHINDAEFAAALVAAW
ncbi:MAG: Tm-1-like ATP-binding domain-containing protein, partial [Alphaproteobacteria bacterium]